MNKSDEGLEGLTKPRESKDKRPAESGGSKKPAEKKAAASHPKGHKLRRIITEELHDGTYHQEHQYEDERGVPSHIQTASSATADDAGSHVAEQFGGGQASEPMQADQSDPQSQGLASEMGGQ